MLFRSAGSAAGVEALVGTDDRGEPAEDDRLDHGDVEVGQRGQRGEHRDATNALRDRVLHDARRRAHAAVVQVDERAVDRERLARLEPECLVARDLLGFGEPQDAAGLVAFLLSPAAKWITGSVIALDGGLTSR